MTAVVVGCEPLHRKKVPVAVYERLKDPNFVIPDFASETIEAAGGLQSWAKAKRLEFDCVVRLYEPPLLSSTRRHGGGFYLTEHHYEIYPWLDSIVISAGEPLSKLVWQLSKGRFSILAGDKRNDTSPIAGFYHDFAEAILMITTAPVRFLDDSVVFTKVNMPVKMNGLWYYPFHRTIQSIDTADSHEPANSYWSEVIFYQNRKSFLVDTIWFADGGKKKFLAVRGYDYTEVEKSGVLVPAKIEVFRTDARGAFQQNLAEINFK